MTSYLRKHPWQRRLLTASMALALGAMAAILALPHVRDYLLLRDLGSTDPGVRSGAISRAVDRAKQYPRTLRRLEEALDDADDAQFTSIVAVLRWLNEFDTPGRKGELIDRAWELELERNPSAETRGMFLAEMLLAGRSNRYVARGLRAAAKDTSASVRAISAALAGRVGDDAALAALLADEDPNVSAAAALDAGLAGRTAHVEALRRLAESAPDLARRSSAAYALACLDPAGRAELLATLLARADEAGDEEARDRMLHVMVRLGPAAGGPPVLGAIRRARQAGRTPPAMALLAAGKLQLAAAGDDIRAVLAAAGEMKADLRVSQVLAALEAAEALNLPVRKEVEAICRKLWFTRAAFDPMLTVAARVLGRQVALDQGDRSGTPAAGECVRTLRQAAVYDFVPTTAPAGGPVTPERTPVPSAAAAVALWGLQTKVSDEYIRASAGDPVALAGDYVAWHLGLAGEERAFELALTMIPPLNASSAERVYNDQRRSTGAMLLAIAARTAAQRAAALERIASRLVGGDLGGEDSFYVRGAYRCALAILGDRESLDKTAGLLETGQFSPRRAVGALTLAGRLTGLDWVLWNPQVSDDDAMYLLVDEGIGDVLATCLPGAPAVDAAADANLAEWQLRILRDWYGIRRAKLRVQWPPS